MESLTIVLRDDLWNHTDNRLSRYLKERPPFRCKVADDLEVPTLAVSYTMWCFLYDKVREERI